MQFSKLFFLFSLPILFLTLNYDEQIHLVKVKRGKAESEILRDFNFNVVEELDSCYIVLAKDIEISVLQKNRIDFKIEVKDIKNKRFFLVYSVKPDDIERLKILGNPIRLEERTILFWHDEDAEVSIPHGYLKKPLSMEPMTSFLSFPAEVEVSEEMGRENELIRNIINEVSESQLYYFVDALQAFQTRYASTQRCEEAGEFIFNYFKSLGLDTSFQTFKFSNYYSRNVIAELKGETNPEDIFIICAHYDSYSNMPAILAPGADDNASGTSAVLEAARILVKYPMDFTVRFICFSAEEWGLYGSKDYASHARSRNEKIIGVLNFDMIAYTDAIPEDLEIIVNPSSEWMAERAKKTSMTYYQYPITKIVSSSFLYSDHASFWQKGYSAFCAIEDNPIRNPYYHTIYDTLGTLNFEFLTSVTKLGLAILSDLAQPIREGYPETPKGVKAKSLIYRSLFNSIKNVQISWNKVNDAVGYNVYRSTTTHLNYKKLNTYPLSNNSFEDKNLSPDITYYYVVTALNLSGLESNYSQEVAVVPEKNQYINRNFLLYQGVLHDKDL